MVHNLLINAPDVLREGIAHAVHGMIAGAAPPQAVIEGAERIGVNLTHVYGLTEVYGPASVCAKQPEWDELPVAERAELNGRQGVTYPLQEAMMVAHPETLQPVPRDAQTMGEIFFRGNITMKGYLKNPRATEEAFRGGWYHTGDLAVVHADGYVKIKDRSKDIIISGGENISTIEVEDVLYSHPAILEAAVVARPDEKWGETPCAFVSLKPGAAPVTAEEIIAWCRSAFGRLQGARSRSCSVRCPRLPPARFRRICCASRRSRSSGSTPELPATRFREQARVASGGGSVDGVDALEREAVQITRSAGFRSSPRQALSAEGLHAHHSADHVAIHVRVSRRADGFARPPRSGRREYEFRGSGHSRCR